MGRAATWATAPPPPTRARSCTRRSAITRTASPPRRPRPRSADPAGKGEPLARAYAAAMRDVARQYPDDLDAATFFADAAMNLRPWNLWTADGAPQPGTEEIVQTLERVLAKNPNHPG